MDLSSLITGAALLAAGGLFIAWRRALQSAAHAELETADSARMAEAAQLAHRREAAQRAALLSAYPEPVFILNAERNLMAANDAAVGLFGALAVPGQSLISATRSAELDELAAHALSGGDDCDRQIMLNGQPFRARAVPIEAGGAVLLLQDVSALQRLGRARRDFIANISHELRTPLTSIRLRLDGQPALDAIDAEVRALEQMAQELLDLAQIESGQVLIRLVSLPVMDLVTAAVERLRPQFAHKGQTVTTDVPAELLVLADADQLQRALGNLLHNAIKFTPTGGAIGVRVFAREDEIVIEVSDTGPGLPSEDLPRVFERFFRGNRARGGGGTGLGLAIAKHVVEAHGGRIEAENAPHPKHGAVFRLTLLKG